MWITDYRGYKRRLELHAANMLSKNIKVLEVLNDGGYTVRLVTCSCSDQFT